MHHIFCWQCPQVCTSNHQITHSSCVTTTHHTNTSGSIRTGMIATATYYLPLAHIGSHCVDAVKSRATWLCQSATLVNVCYREREKEGERWRKTEEGGRPKGTNAGHERPEGSSLATLWYQSKHTSYSCIPLKLCCLCVWHFPNFSRFSEHFLHFFYRGVGCLDMPQFLPLGANSTASVCTGGGQRIGFYPPLYSP